MTSVELRVEADAEAASHAAAELLASAAGDVVLTGGSTPRRAYELTAAIRTDWSDVELWWGDERCVAPDDERSNYRLAREALLDHVGVVRAVHRIRGELPPPEAAAEYDAELRGRRLDLVLLGLGPDGHTASLFPHAPALREHGRLAVAAPAGLEPFVDRVTLTVPALASAARVVFLVTGEAKAEAARRAFAGEPDEATPASLVRGEQTAAILDRAAAALL